MSLAKTRKWLVENGYYDSLGKIADRLGLPAIRLTHRHCASCKLRSAEK
jgi:hypothetical protein